MSNHIDELLDLLCEECLYKDEVMDFVERMSLHRPLLETRGRKGWSQERLSKETGVSINTISNIERGAVEPRLQTLVKLAEALGVDVEEIRG